MRTASKTPYYNASELIILLTNQSGTFTAHSLPRSNHRFWLVNCELRRIPVPKLAAWFKNESNVEQGLLCAQNKNDKDYRSLKRVV